MMNNVPSPVLQFDTDFDFDSSNAQFIKEELEREKMSTRGNQLKWFSSKEADSAKLICSKHCCDG